MQRVKLSTLEIGDRFIIPILPADAVESERAYSKEYWDAELRGWHPDGVAMLAFPTSDGRAFKSAADKELEVLVWN